MISPDLTPPPVRSTPSPVRARLLRASVWFLGALALLPLYERVSGAQATNSDDALVPLQAEVAAHGDLLLRGWTVVTDALYTTEVPFYLAAIRLYRMSPALLSLIPALIYVLTMLCVVRLAAGGRPWRAGAGMGAALAFALAGLPSGMAAGLVLVPAIHDGTYLAALAALVCLDAPGGRPSRLRLAGWTVLSVLAFAGDTYALWVLILPAVLVCGARWLVARRQRLTEEEQAERRTEAIIAGLSLGGVVAAKVALRAVHMLGGYAVLPFSANFVPLEQFGTHVRLTVGGLLELFGGDFFGTSPHSKAGLLALACLPGFVLAVISLRRVRWPGQADLVARENPDTERSDRVTQILAASVLTVVVAYLFSTAAISMDTTRYLVPCLLWGAVLAGRAGTGWMTRWIGAPALAAVVAVVGLAHLVLCVQEARRPRFAALPENMTLTNWLSAHGLTNGYGDYWSSNITTLRSGGRITVRAVVADNGHIRPYRYNSASSWYVGTPAHFLVIGPLSGRLVQPVDAAFAARVFGPPAQTVQVGSDTVLVWNKDITPSLQQ